MSPRLLLLSIVVVSFGSPVLAADWPQWQGPNRDNKSAEKGLLTTFPADGPKLLWSVNELSAIGTGYGCPAIVGDKLFILGADSAKKEAKEACVCLNVKHGKPVWKTPLETGPGAFLDTWGAGTRSTPTVDGDHVYVLGVMGDLVCLTKNDGTVVWKKNLVSDFGGKIPTWGYSESVLIDGDQVVCTPGTKSGMIALNKKTGATIWECKDLTDGAGYSSVVPAVVGGVRQYVQQTMKSAVGVRATDGKLLWQVGEIKRLTAVIPTPVVKGDNVFFTAAYLAGCELFKLTPDGDGTKATKVYTSKAVQNHHGGVIELGGKIYGYSESKKWVCFDMLAGGDDPVWSSDKLGKGSITYADNHFYCYSENEGTLACIKATEAGWEETGRFTIPKLSQTRPRQGKVWAHPVIANGKLYLRDYEILYCFDISQNRS